MKRVALIGPVLPYRGGISQHTTMLAKELANCSHLLIISFCKQYPGWLFPGRADKESLPEEFDVPVSYIINSLNPLTWQEAVHACSRFDAELVVIPWWTVYWFPCFWYIARKLRHEGKKVVFICHNVIEHESAVWKTALATVVLRQGSKHLVHSQQDRTKLLSLLNTVNVKVQHHPLFTNFPESNRSLLRRANVELLFFGFVRQYKGLDILIDALAKIKRQDVFLTVAGEFWQDEMNTRRRIAELGLLEKIEIIARYLNAEEVADCFSRADLVVLPYRSATGSGVLSLAYHYNKPVLVTRVGSLSELVINGVNGFIVEPNDPTKLADVIERITSEQLVRMQQAINRLKHSLTWRSLANKILED